MAETRANYDSGVGFFEIRSDALSSKDYRGFSGEGWIFGRGWQDDGTRNVDAAFDGFICENQRQKRGEEYEFEEPGGCFGRNGFF